MDFKHLMVFAILSLFALNAFADATLGVPDVNVLNRDGNFYFPKGTTVTVSFTVADNNNEPTDANIFVYYLDNETMTRTEITSAIGGVLDRNSSNFCVNPLSNATQVCSLTWAVPDDLDGNFWFDVNVWNITGGGDGNNVSDGSFIVDTNACSVGFQNNNAVITLTSVCAGHGSSDTVSYGRTRTGTCPQSFITYIDPVNLVGLFGDITFCYFSTDNLGNVSETFSQTFTLKSGVVNILDQIELLIAAIFLFFILSVGYVSRDSMNPAMFILLLVAGVFTVIVITILSVMV